MAEKYYSILTNRGKELEAQSSATGKPVIIKDFVVGDGNGQAVKPDPALTTLVHEVYRATISALQVSPDQANQFIAQLVLPAGVGGFVVREVGLLTDAGELYAVANCAAIEKPASGISVRLQFRLAVSETADIELKVASGDGLFLRQDANLGDVEDAAESRKNIGLKSAATADVTDSARDTTAGRVLKVGDYGVGLTRSPLTTGIDFSTYRFILGEHLFVRMSTCTNIPTGLNGEHYFIFVHGLRDATGSPGLTFINYNDPSEQWTAYRRDSVDGGLAWTLCRTYNTGFKPTAGDVGALPITGGTLKGDLIVENSVGVGDGSGGFVTGNFDGAGFDGNNLNIKSWNGIGFKCSADDIIRAFISTGQGIIGAAEHLLAGAAIFNKNGDVYGDIWNTGSGPGWISAYLSAKFPTKDDVSVALAGKPGRQYITQVGVYNNDKSKPFMLHDDNSGIFLATDGWVSGNFATSAWTIANFLQGGIRLSSPGTADNGNNDNNFAYAPDGAVVTAVQQKTNFTAVQYRYIQYNIGGNWYTAWVA
ncbi:phage tail protein [Enterobacter chuandaensis]|uniref:Phage tail protein n=1 Tax=Enterobacter chuandaensis TaxID=2497875 RepID=A0AA96M2J3_9ENTR|nr:phage tail protein [Enterobacter chuandaensis]WNS38329.1 phage tail protein [Enterobacter chuandaensis]